MNYREAYRVYEIVPEHGKQFSPEAFITAYNIVKDVDGVSFNNVAFKRLMLQFEGHVTPYEVLEDVMIAIKQIEDKKYA